jgi:NAD+ synthase (glutamine-hydrolysing)
MKIALCQLNPLVGDIKGNVDRLCGVIDNHQSEQCDLFIFPELFIQGYPPRDLLEKKWFIEQSHAALKKIINFSKNHPSNGILFGTILPSGKTCGKQLVNAAVLIANGQLLHEQHKTLLPTYDIFDETRYFEPATATQTVTFKGESLGITICEDAWNDSELRPNRLYDRDPVTDLAAAHATLLINISASPFHIGKERIRASIMCNHARKHVLPLLFINQIGGNDELIFDGNSMVFDSSGQVRMQVPAFTESISIINTDALPPPQPIPE